MPTKPDHKPAGPGGGQFTHPERPEAAVALGAAPRPAETQRDRRGHDFYPPAAEMATWPKLYATDNEGPIGEKPIQAHYFQGGMDWYIAEYDPAGNEAFGYTDLGMGGGEWGYIPLGDVEELRGQMGLPIERDLDFTPGTPANECIDKYKAANERFDEYMAEIDERIDFGWDGADDEDPMSPEDRKLWDGFHRHAYDFGHAVLGVTGFEDTDKVERFAGFAANAYQENDWNGEMDIHGVVDDWMAQEHPLG